MTKLTGKYVGDGEYIALSNGTTWPAPGGDLSWRLRHAPKQVTEQELMMAAYIIECYEALIRKTQKDRNSVIEAIKDVETPEAF